MSDEDFDWYASWKERQARKLQVQEFRGNRRRKRRKMTIPQCSVPEQRLADVKALPRPSKNASLYCTIGGHVRCPGKECDCPCH